MAFISKDEITNIRNTANIVDIIGSYLPLTQKGKNYFCVCPFHDDHSPSMSVSPDKQVFKCFVCGATGNVFTFVENYEDVSFGEAAKIVAEKCGLELTGEFTSNKKQSDDFASYYEVMNLTQKFFTNNLKTEFGAPALEYLTSRGINEEAIKKFGIGLSLDQNNYLLNLLTKKNYDVKVLNDLGLANNNYDTFIRRITFPLWDKDGNIVGFSARVYRNEKDVSKYMNSKETIIFKKGETLYNYHLAKNEAKRLKEIIVVEGFMDAIRLSVNGINNVVALCGTAMTKDQINLLKKLRAKIILCLDNDNAGLLATLKNGEELKNAGVEPFVIRLSNQKDPDEYIVANGVEAFKSNLKEPLSFFEFKLNYLKKDKNLNNVEDLSDYINDVLKDLSTTNDPILKEVTLNKISEEYHLSTEILKEKLSSMTPVEAQIPLRQEPLKPTRKDAFTIASEHILFYMMNGETYIELYKKNLGYFENPTYRNIANEIMYYISNNENINLADFVTYINDLEEIKAPIMNIINDNLNDDINEESMLLYIDVVNKHTTKEEIKKLKQQMKNELDIDKKMKIAMKIAELKKDVL